MPILSSERPKSKVARRSLYDLKKQMLSLAAEMHEFSDDEIFTALDDLRGYEEMLVDEMVSSFLRHRTKICKSQG